MRFDANIAFLFSDRPILERFRVAQDAGFSAFEMWSCEEATAAEIAVAATAAGINIVSCNAPVGDLRTGGAGLSGVPGREREFEDAIRATAAAAVELGCQLVNIGPSRIASENDRTAALATLARNLAFASEELGRAGIRAVVEPMNPVDLPGVLLAKVPYAMEVIEQAGHPNAHLLFDIYHVSQIDASPIRCLEQCFGKIGHIQIADVPGRGAPGTGAIDFPAFFNRLDQLHYRGWVGAEYRPAMPWHSTHAWLQGLVPGAS